MEPMDVYNTIFNEVPIAIFIVDADVRIQFLNAEAKKIIDTNTEFFDRRGGEVLKCIYSTVHEKGCGHAEECKSCIVRNSVKEAAAGKRTHKHQTALKLKAGDKEVLFHALITTAPFKYNGRELYLLMVENVNELVALKDTIPICCNCKKVRNDDEYWMQVEHYLQDFMVFDVAFSICPDCVESLYPGSKKN